jgi:hypothetical protein
LLKGGVDFVIVACMNSAILDKVTRIINGSPEEIAHRAKAYLLSDILKMEPEQILQHLTDRKGVTQDGKTSATSQETPEQS